MLISNSQWQANNTMTLCLLVRFKFVSYDNYHLEFYCYKCRTELVGVYLQINNRY